MTKSSVVEMIGINKNFSGVAALADVDFTLQKGEILGLVGANGAGKSTLMNVLGGVTLADSGIIKVDGEVVSIKKPKHSQDLGIAFVQQEVATFATLSVVDNLFITDFPTRGSILDKKAMNSRAVEVLARLGCEFGPEAIVDNLSAGDRQIVTIARALLSGPRVIILDEPTSSLSLGEKERFFEILKKLSQEGVSFIFISHFLDEIFSVCHKILVMRNGKVAGSGNSADILIGQVVNWMIGHEADRVPLNRNAEAIGSVSLQVQNLQRHGVLHDINLQVHRGEIVGVWGLMGSGRTELVRAIAGLDHIDSGGVLIDSGSGLEELSSSQRLRLVGHVPEDRRKEGLFLPISVSRNIGMASLSLLARLGFVVRKREMELANGFVERLGIKVSSAEQKVSTLSGGNQQKVVIARWVALAPPVYVLDEPMRGLDIGAKTQIRKLIAELADGGMAILVIDSELQELRLVADRYIVLDRGRIVGNFPRETSEETLMSFAAGAGVPK
jgi:ribose transport system ATP-binding protein